MRWRVSKNHRITHPSGGSTFFLKQWTRVTFRNQLQSTSKRTNNLLGTMQIQSLSLCCLSVQPPPAGFPYLHSFSLTFFTSLYLLPLLSQISITIFTLSNPFLPFPFWFIRFWTHSKTRLLILKGHRKI